MNDAPLSAEKTANILGISRASISNWQRHGYLNQDSDGHFPAEEVYLLKEKIDSGEIKRLGSRANKLRASGTIKPPAGFGKLCAGLASLEADVPELMFLLMHRQFAAAGLAAAVPSGRLTRFSAADYGNEAARALLLREFQRLDAGPAFHAAAEKIAEMEIPRLLPAETDLAAIVYQALSGRGQRSESGSFYTPPAIASELVLSAGKQAAAAGPEAALMLDPCCGTGAFLLAFTASGGRPENAFGMDADPTAAFCAAANMILQHPDIETIPGIYTADSLTRLPQELPPRFDMIVTNPPWGGRQNGGKSSLKQKYPGIRSGESFSYFIARSIGLLRDGGAAAFVLPESFTNVRRHGDIRRLVTDRCRITDISPRGRLFKSVYTRVITVELVKDGTPTGGGTAPSEAGFIINPDFSFSINVSGKDAGLIDRLYSAAHSTLEGKAEWALGIVTGDNDRFLAGTPGPGAEPVITGGDILPGELKPPAQFIDFRPERLQQIAPEWKYRVPEKLVYRFISKRLVFAVDRGGLLTLNSANIVIPEAGQLGMTLTDIMRLFNSEPYNFVYRKRFNSVKVLRSHLEQLPLIHPDRLPGLFTEDELRYMSSPRD